MATPFLKVYEAFLSKITADEWTVEEDMAIVERDWQQLLDSAVFRFKYPRVSLEKVVLSPDELPPNTSPVFRFGFKGDLGQDEIQLLAIYMKHEWVRRCIASWENIRQLYADKEFSQANHLSQLLKLETQVWNECRNAQDIYDKVRGKKPAKAFKRLAGKKGYV